MAKKYRLTEDQKRRNRNVLQRIAIQGAERLKGKAMMYFVEKKRIFKSRGDHVYDVALITKELVARLGGHVEEAELMGLAHDFGHSTLAHTGEAPLGRFMLSPDEFKEWESEELINPRKGFDHSKHSLKAFQKKLLGTHVRINKFIANGIEAHSSGSGVPRPGMVAHKSIESECVMRADKIASAISDTQDMIKAGVLKLDDKSLMASLNNKNVRDLVKARLYPGISDFSKKENYAIVLLGGKQEYENKKALFREECIALYPDLSEEQINTLMYTMIEDAMTRKMDKEINNYLEDVKIFMQYPIEVQRERMIQGIVDATKNARGSKLKTGYQIGYESQLVVPKDIEAVLAAMRGLLQSKEEERSLGKTGQEVEGLVETVARYIYKHEEEFKNHQAFQYWKTDEKGKKCEWKETITYSLVDFTDLEFKEFVIGLLEKEEVREVLKHCKYRDPRDKAGMDYCEADFSTKEAIEAAFIVDKDRVYQPSASDRAKRAGQMTH